MKPQTIKYGNGHNVSRLDGSNTFLIHSGNLLWGEESYPPTLFVEGILEDKLKFDFYKTYKNKDGEIMHVEYRSLPEGYFKLVVIAKHI